MQNKQRTMTPTSRKAYDADARAFWARNEREVQQERQRHAKAVARMGTRIANMLRDIERKAA